MCGLYTVHTHYRRDRIYHHHDHLFPPLASFDDAPGDHDHCTIFRLFFSRPIFFVSNTFFSFLCSISQFWVSLVCLFCCFTSLARSCFVRAQWSCVMSSSSMCLYMWDKHLLTTASKCALALLLIFLLSPLSFAVWSVDWSSVFAELCMYMCKDDCYTWSAVKLELQMSLHVQHNFVCSVGDGSVKGQGKLGAGLLKSALVTCSYLPLSPN